MSDEPSNTLSDEFRAAFDYFTEAGIPPDEVVRSWLTDDFVYEDRRSGPSFPIADASTYTRVLKSVWELEAGRPQWQAKVLAVRGERLAVAAVTLDYGNGMLYESINVFARDATSNKLRRAVDFDIDRVDEAMAELDRLHNETSA